MKRKSESEKFLDKFDTLVQARIDEFGRSQLVNWIDELALWDLPSRSHFNAVVLMDDGENTVWEFPDGSLIEWNNERRCFFVVDEETFDSSSFQF